MTGPDSSYDVWVINAGNRELLRHRLSIGHLKASHRFSGGQIVDHEARDKFHDVWPDPAPRADGTYKIYAAAQKDWMIVKQAGKNGAVQRYEWDGKSESLKQDNWGLLTDQSTRQIRLVCPQPFNDYAGSVPEEFTKIPDDIGKKLAKGASIIYAMLDGSREVFVAFTDATTGAHQWRVTIAAQSYNGIAVDPHFLWVYGKEGFQCTTHAAVMNSLFGKNPDGTKPTLRWISGNANQQADLLDLCPSADGTVLVSNNALCAQTQYRIDFERAAIVLNDRWENLDRVNAVPQAQKLPLFCWPEVKSLMKSVGMEV